MCTFARLLVRQMLTQEGEDFAPAIHRRLGPIQRPVPIEDTMAGTVVAVELVTLSVLLQRGLMLVHLVGARRAVLIAEYAEQRAGEILSHLDWRDGCVGVEFLLTHHDAAAPEIGAGVHILPLARIKDS